MATGAATVRSVPARASRGLWHDVARRLLRNRVAMVGLIVIAIFACAAILAPWIAPYAPNAGSLSVSLQPPSSAHLMGTDIQGRDEFSRVLFGIRTSLEVGVGSVIVAVLLGVIVGAAAGGAGGGVDVVLMRVVDVALAIPAILLAIGVVAFLGQGLPQITIAVAVSHAPVFARLLRGSLLSLREADYVIAARSMGASPVRLLLRHMLPNALTPLIVAATLALGTAIINVAGLGFLGLGPPDPRMAELGTMLQDSTKFLALAQYLIFFPGAAIVIIVIGVNLLGDGLREALDPRLRR